jgi:Flp pilus assembly protein TadD
LARQIPRNIGCYNPRMMQKACDAPLRLCRARSSWGARHLLLAAFFLLLLNSSAVFAQNDSADAQHLAQRAQTEALRGEWTASTITYEKAVRVAPRDPNLRMALGLVLAKAGRFADAIASYQQALQLSPRNVVAEIGLAQAYRGVRNRDEARLILQRAHREHPRNPQPLSVLGDLEIELQTYDAAIQNLRAALALDPAANETRNLLAAAYKAKGDEANALAHLTKVLARDRNNALAHYLRAEIFSDRNQDARALPDAEKVLELQPQNPRGRVLLAKILLRTPGDAAGAEVTARCSRAVAALQPLAETQPNDSETLFLLARAFRCAGNSDEAQKTLAAFEAASQTDRTGRENEKQAWHLVEQANEHAQMNDFSGAVDLLQQALEKDPKSGAAYSQLAKLYYSAGDIDNASRSISHALELEPYQPDFLYVQGKIFERQGKLDEALAAFERTTLVNPKESDAYFELGVVYQQRNDRARALAAYKKAVALSPDDSDYRRSLAALEARTP